MHGLLFASWTAHIPALARHLRLDDGALGLVLLGAPVGAVAAVALGGRLLPRLGSRRAVRAALVLYCLAGLLVGAAGTPAALAAGLFAWGFGQGALDVSMNTQAVYVERRADRPLMPGLHGAWGLGAFTGAAAGTAGVALGLGLLPQLLILGLPALAVTLGLSRRMLPDDAHEVQDPRKRRAAELSPADPSALPPGARRRGSPPVALLLLALAAFASMLCEGAAADWSAVYLRTGTHASAAVAGLGYTVFALALVLVRLGGNRLLAAVPARRLVPALAFFAAVGFGTGLLVGGSLAMLVGLACLGAGLGLVVPTTFGAAGATGGRHPGRSVATVSGFGWVGFVAGPPAIGGLAAATSLHVALGLLPVLAMVAAASARAAHRPDALG